MYRTHPQFLHGGGWLCAPMSMQLSLALAACSADPPQAAVLRSSSTPALLMRMLSWPNWATVSCTILSASASTPTSPTTKPALAPVVTACSSATHPSSFSRRRPVMTTAAPAWTSTLAISRPMPVPPPVTCFAGRRGGQKSASLHWILQNASRTQYYRMAHSTIECCAQCPQLVQLCCAVQRVNAPAPPAPRGSVRRRSAGARVAPHPRGCRC